MDGERQVYGAAPPGSATQLAILLTRARLCRDAARRLIAAIDDGVMVVTVFGSR
jgi:hypothetical protein